MTPFLCWLGRDIPCIPFEKKINKNVMSWKKWFWCLYHSFIFVHLSFLHIRICASVISTYSYLCIHHFFKSIFLHLSFLQIHICASIISSHSHLCIRHFLTFIFVHPSFLHIHLCIHHFFTFIFVHPSFLLAIGIK